MWQATAWTTAQNLIYKMWGDLQFFKKKLGWFVIVDSNLLNANIQAGHVGERKACNVCARLVYNYRRPLDNGREASPWSFSSANGSNPPPLWCHGNKTPSSCRKFKRERLQQSAFVWTYHNPKSSWCEKLQSNHDCRPRESRAYQEFWRHRQTVCSDVD